jgi:hypothetical protein
MTDTTPEQEAHPENWFVLLVGLPMSGGTFDLGSSLTLRRLTNRLTVFDLAAAGAAGFKQWAMLEPLAPNATAEVQCPTVAASMAGYDALNKCWLVSALLALRGYPGHICPAASAYSWNLIAGHQEVTAPVFREQAREEGFERAVHASRRALPPFQGGLLDYHVAVLLPDMRADHPFNEEEATWFRGHFETFNRLASGNERFRFALEAATDWRFAKEPRAAVARLWSGIESLFSISSELVYRVSQMAACVLAPRGPERLEAFRWVKKLYGLRYVLRANSSRLALWSLAASLPITIALWLLGSWWSNRLIARSEVVDQVTTLSTCVAWLQTPYFPAFAAWISLSSNPHQPNDAVAFLAVLAQTFLMVFLGVAAAARLRPVFKRLGRGGRR